MASSRRSVPPSSLAASAGRLLAPVRQWAGLPLAFSRDFMRSAPDLVALVAMAALGLGISIYLTTVHYAGVKLVCTTGGVVNCAKVTSSAYSVLPGTQLPVTIPGMLWFTVSGGLAVVALVALRRGVAEPARLRLAHAVWGGLGMAFVLYLVYAEIVRLHQICEWCTAVHILTFLTLLIALTRLQHAQTAAEGMPVPSRAPAVSQRPTASNTRSQGAHQTRASSNGSNTSRGDGSRGTRRSASRTAARSASRGRRR